MAARRSSTGSWSTDNRRIESARGRHKKRLRLISTERDSAGQGFRAHRELGCAAAQGPAHAGCLGESGSLGQIRDTLPAHAQPRWTSRSGIENCTALRRTFVWSTSSAGTGFPRLPPNASVPISMRPFFHLNFKCESAAPIDRAIVSPRGSTQAPQIHRVAGRKNIAESVYFRTASPMLTVELTLVEHLSEVPQNRRTNRRGPADRPRRLRRYLQTRRMRKLLQGLRI
jgi:hypothetical protein